MTDNAKSLIRLLDQAFAEADENDDPCGGWVYAGDRSCSAGLRHIDNKHPRISAQIQRRNNYYGFQIRWDPYSTLPY